MPSGQSKGKGTEEGSQQLGISACHQLLVSLLTAGRLPPNQFSEEAVFKAPVLGEMGCETASVVIRTRRNLINGAFLPSLPLLHLGNSETASCLPFCWQTGRVRERTELLSQDSDDLFLNCRIKGQPPWMILPGGCGQSPWGGWGDWCLRWLVTHQGLHGHFLLECGHPKLP